MPVREDSLIKEELSERLRAARSVFVLTGAGVSAESGVPTFRGGGGAAVWKGLPFDVISSASMVRSDLAGGLGVVRLPAQRSSKLAAESRAHDARRLAG